MKLELKSIKEQVVVILGAASGIGRETALRFAEHGAKIVVAARSEPGLAKLVDEITARGGQGAYAVCDVSDFSQVQNVAETAMRTFGRIDTWVNVAAISSMRVWRTHRRKNSGVSWKWTTWDRCMERLPHCRVSAKPERAP